MNIKTKLKQFWCGYNGHEGHKLEYHFQCDDPPCMVRYDPDVHPSSIISKYILIRTIITKNKCTNCEKDLNYLSESIRNSLGEQIKELTNMKYTELKSKGFLNFGGETKDERTRETDSASG